MANIIMVSYVKLLKYPLECCYQFMFPKFRLVSLKTQGVHKHVKLKNFHIQTILSTALVDAFISDQVY